MCPPPHNQRGEIFHPSVFAVLGHLGFGELTSRQDNVVRIVVRYRTGVAEFKLYQNPLFQYIEYLLYHIL